jgi:hypothetical protein
MVIRRMATRGTVIRGTVIRGTVIRRTDTVKVRIVIHTMGGTIPGLGTATVRMDIPTIGDRARPSKLYRLDRALSVLVLFSLIKLPALLAQ